MRAHDPRTMGRALAPLTSSLALSFRPCATHLLVTESDQRGVLDGG